MFHYALIAVQIIVLLVLGVLLWQVWHFMRGKEIPDDEPLGEERAKYLKRRLTAIGICAAVEALLQLASSVLRFIEVI